MPGLLGVTEVDLDPGVDGELGVFGHLFALIPGQRLPQMLRQLSAFDQGADGGLSLPHQQVALPMTGPARSSTSAGRSEIITGSTIWPFPDGVLPFGSAIGSAGTQIELALRRRIRLRFLCRASLKRGLEGF